jgi:acyl-CoA synthetase (AMP-forming)/AMP-acid ligase II
MHGATLVEPAQFGGPGFVVGGLTNEGSIPRMVACCEREAYAAALTRVLPCNPVGKICRHYIASIAVGYIKCIIRICTTAGRSTALEVNNKSLTYASLGSRVDRLARDLRSHGVGCGDIVALCLKRTENLVIGMLGVLRAGAAYLPLNPSDPSYRLGQVTSHAPSRFIVTDSQSMMNLPDVSSHVCVLDRRPAMATEVAGGEALYGPEAADVAYVIYTSGTTGSPRELLSRTARFQMF